MAENIVYSIENESIKISVKTSGAELISLVDQKTGREYMWSGDEKYWNRVSPVLFPFVGKLVNQTYTYKGVFYSGVPQHGYARDSIFALLEKKENEIWFELTPDTLWKERYPFDFKLHLGYRLEGRKVYVLWEVQNDSQEDMPFSIGAHPAFVMPGGESKNGYYLNLHNGADQLVCGELNENGLLRPEARSFVMEAGRLPVTDALFDDDALIVDAKDISVISIETPEKEAFLQVSFDTPLVGIWSPSKTDAPFVCIEPWFGRSDRMEFTGDLADREYGNMIAPGESFQAEYVIELL